MKLHHTLVEKLINVYEINSGWREQKKLRDALTNLDLSVYQQQNGQEILVLTEELEREKRNITQNRNNNG